jgi:cobalt-zinc-cadmium efflux system outer membrane protein
VAWFWQCVSVVLGCLFIVAVAATPSLTQARALAVGAAPLLSLTQARALAAEQHPAVRQARAELEAARGAEAEAGSFLFENPQLQGQLWSGAPFGHDDSELELQLQQTIEVAGQRGLRRDASAEAARQAASLLHLARAQAESETTAAYARLEAAGRRLELAREIQATSEQAADAAKVRLERGDVSEVDAALLAADAARLWLQVQELAAARETAREELAQALGAVVPPEVALDPPLELDAAWVEETLAFAEGTQVRRSATTSEGNVPAAASTSPATASTSPATASTSPAASTSQESLATVRRAPPDLDLLWSVTAETQALAAARSSLSLAERKRIPDVSLGFGFRRAAEGPLLDNHLAAVLQIPLPLWNWQQGAVGQARAQARWASEKLDAARVQAVVKLRAAARKARLAIAAEERLSAVAPQALRALETLNRARAAGQLNLSEVLVKRDALVQAQLGAIDAYVERVQALAELQRTTARGDLR